MEPKSLVDVDIECYVPTVEPEGTSEIKAHFGLFQSNNNVTPAALTSDKHGFCSTTFTPRFGREQTKLCDLVHFRASTAIGDVMKLSIEVNAIELDLLLNVYYVSDESIPKGKKPAKGSHTRIGTRRLTLRKLMHAVRPTPLEILLPDRHFATAELTVCASLSGLTLQRTTEVPAIPSRAESIMTDTSTQSYAASYDTLHTRTGVSAGAGSSMNVPACTPARADTGTVTHPAIQATDTPTNTHIICDAADIHTLDSLILTHTTCVRALVRQFRLLRHQYHKLARKHADDFCREGEHVRIPILLYEHERTPSAPVLEKIGPVQVKVSGMQQPERPGEGAGESDSAEPQTYKTGVLSGDAHDQATHGTRIQPKNPVGSARAYAHSMQGTPTHAHTTREAHRQPQTTQGIPYPERKPKHSDYYEQLQHVLWSAVQRAVQAGCHGDGGVDQTSDESHAPLNTLETPTDRLGPDGAKTAPQSSTNAGEPNSDTPQRVVRVCTAERDHGSCRRAREQRVCAVIVAHLTSLSRQLSALFVEMSDDFTPDRCVYLGSIEKTMAHRHQNLYRSQLSSTWHEARDNPRSCLAYRQHIPLGAYRASFATKAADDQARAHALAQGGGTVPEVRSMHSAANELARSAFTSDQIPGHVATCAYGTAHAHPDITRPGTEEHTQRTEWAESGHAVTTTRHVEAHAGVSTSGEVRSTTATSGEVRSTTATLNMPRQETLAGHNTQLVAKASDDMTESVSGQAQASINTAVGTHIDEEWDMRSPSHRQVNCADCSAHAALPLIVGDRTKTHTTYVPGASPHAIAFKNRTREKQGKLEQDTLERGSGSQDNSGTLEAELLSQSLSAPAQAATKNTYTETTSDGCDSSEEPPEIHNGTRDCKGTEVGPLGSSGAVESSDITRGLASALGRTHLASGSECTTGVSEPPICEPGSGTGSLESIAKPSGLVPASTDCLKNAPAYISVSETAKSPSEDSTSADSSVSTHGSINRTCNHRCEWRGTFVSAVDDTFDATPMPAMYEDVYGHVAQQRHMHTQPNQPKTQAKPPHTPCMHVHTQHRRDQAQRRREKERGRGCGVGVCTYLSDSHANAYTRNTMPNAAHVCTDAHTCARTHHDAGPPTRTSMPESPHASTGKYARTMPHAPDPTHTEDTRTQHPLPQPAQTLVDLQTAHSHAPNEHVATPQMHVVVLVHGLAGSRYDFRVYAALLRRRSICNGSRATAKLHLLLSKANEDKTYDSLPTQAARLCSEIIECEQELRTKRGANVCAISFIAHSQGALVVRLCVTLSHFRPFLPLCRTFLSLAGPHLGTPTHAVSPLVGFGLWFLSNFNGSDSIAQLKRADGGRVEDSLLYRLAHHPVGLGVFRTVILVATRLDGYVPVHSALIHSNEAMTTAEANPASTNTIGAAPTSAQAGAQTHTHARPQQDASANTGTANDVTSLGPQADSEMARAILTPIVQHWESENEIETTRAHMCSCACRAGCTGCAHRLEYTCVQPVCISGAVARGDSDTAPTSADSPLSGAPSGVGKGSIPQAHKGCACHCTVPLTSSAEPILDGVCSGPTITSHCTDQVGSMDSLERGRDLHWFGSEAYAPRDGETSTCSREGTCAMLSHNSAHAALRPLEAMSVDCRGGCDGGASHGGVRVSIATDGSAATGGCARHTPLQLTDDTTAEMRTRETHPRPRTGCASTAAQTIGADAAHTELLMRLEMIYPQSYKGLFADMLGRAVHTGLLDNIPIVHMLFARVACHFS
ncbi:hypothetical protein SARC_02645 [Sphaeroforma arctica JP610]|uniref:DUF676 domain-containing protein n=1 Tax=Sphaeroforma arctica JP610 TaxID=667725 RepID=A0A0L0G801_9EUKA|nr:hypothetical protein SARC_02645 [Sphaeroforma arctica JP610]KNC85152.1 hypothetical protein SARC_02645 [Sphaeroforma arctica JP610]|eukprot:XP_014159054.1 hypothetical protein SARC_02645 [Sphaeroforma arctica JP610]